MTGGKETGKKRKSRYKIQLVADENAGIGQSFSVSLWLFVAFFVGVALLIIAALSYCLALTGELNTVHNNEQRLITDSKELELQNKTLLMENRELQEKVSILSDTVNSKVQREQEREAEIAQSYVPTGFPLKGTASYSEAKTQLDGKPIAVFHASRGTSVIATANGTVSSIAGDMESGYIVMIDHGNGYYTVYRNGSHPKVKEGEIVTPTTELFAIEAGKETLGYQIIENDEYIDPLSLMETYG